MIDNMNTNNMIYELDLTSDQLESILGVSHMTIYRWRKEGLPFVKNGTKNSSVRFKLEEVEKWLEENEVKVIYRKIKG